MQVLRAAELEKPYRRWASVRRSAASPVISQNFSAISIRTSSGTMPRPAPPLKRQTDPDRPYTADVHTGFCSIDCCAPHRRWERSISPESVPGRPANSIQAGSGYTDHVVKPAEVHRNDAIGPAATIPYSHCHNQVRGVADPTKNHRHNQRSWHPPEGQRTGCIVDESYETSFVIRNYFDAVLIQPVCGTYRRPLPDKPSSTAKSPVIM